LKNPLVVKTNCPQSLMIDRGNARRVARYLHYIIEHHLLLLGDRRLAVVIFERGYQFLIQRYPTQKLCVRLDSIMATVRDRHHCRNHLMLSPAERQVR
jgi:hypothetical protein